MLKGKVAVEVCLFISLFVLPFSKQESSIYHNRPISRKTVLCLNFKVNDKVTFAQSEEVNIKPHKSGTAVVAFHKVSLTFPILSIKISSMFWFDWMTLGRYI